MATVVTNAAPRPERDPRLCGFLVWFVIFSTAFFGGLQILGYVNLASEWRVVNLEYSAAIGLIAAVGVYAWYHRKIAAPFEITVSSGGPRSSAAGIFRLGGGLARSLAMVTFLTFVAIAAMLMRGFPSGYEATAYHLPLAVHAFQSQSLRIWDASFMHTSPANESLYLGFLLQAFPEHVAVAANVLLLAPLFAAVYGLGRATGADEKASLLAALGLLSIPIVAFSAFEASADVGGIAFLAIAVYFAALRRGPVWMYRALSGLSAGLAFGFKSFHLLSAGYLGAIILLQDRKGPRDEARQMTFWSAIQPAAIFSLSVFAMASFWLVRNYVQLGNPLYPLYLSAFSHFHWTKPFDKEWADMHLAQFQWVRSSAEWFLYPWLEWQNAGDNFKHSSGLGSFFATTVPVACVVSLVRAIRKQGTEWRTIAFLLGGGVFVLFSWAYLDAREPRYAMGALVFLVPLVAATVGLSENRSRRAFEVIIAICVSIMLFVIFSKKLVQFGASFVYAHHYQRYAFYGYPSLIDTLPPGSTVFNLANRPLNYGLFGATHTNRVISYNESFRKMAIQSANMDPEGAPQRPDTKYAVLKKLGAGYIITEGLPRFVLDDCVSLNEVQRLEKEPGVGTPLPHPFVLYKIRYCNERGSQR